ncbi:ETS- transcription factor Elf-2 [Clonorchis sinensis]|uniref:ETS- transcription factor Elf-2 n=1 Tax=Clonorchis sinensis TaxID=79923 RepID=A0A419PHN7_CLOSI|nr:ETS- transcription factor Elf-2 [Clonorchis sinensis]
MNRIYSSSNCVLVDQLMEMKATQLLLKARWRYPEVTNLQDGVYVTSCVAEFLTWKSSAKFEKIFGSEAGKDLFAKFQDLRLSVKNEQSTDDENDCESNGCGAQFNGQTVRRRKPILWQFLMCLLELESTKSYIRWKDKTCGLFELTEDKGTKFVAFLWGRATNNPKMTYDTMSRSLRSYKENGIFCPSTPPLTHRFNYEHPEIVRFRDSLKDTQNCKPMVMFSKLVEQELCLGR